MKNTKEILGEGNIKRKRQKGKKKERIERKQKEKRIVNNEQDRKADISYNMTFWNMKQIYNNMTL